MIRMEFRHEIRLKRRIRRNMKTLLLTLIGTLALCAAGTDAAAEKQVTAAMEAMKQAMIHRDGAALAKLMHDDLLYTHSTGSFENKADFVKSISSGKSIVEKLEFTEIERERSAEKNLVVRKQLHIRRGANATKRGAG